MFYPVLMFKSSLKSTPKNTSKRSVLERIALTKLTFFCSLLAALVLIVVTSSNALANEDLTTVYKDTKPDGSVSFSDKPNEKSEMLKIAPVPTVPAVSPNNAFTQQAEQEDKPYQRYDSLSILAPANNSAFYSGSGEVDVLLDIKPALLEGDQVQIFLDGQLMQSGNFIESRLQTISRGTHTLLVKLISASGKVHESATSNFTVHRPSIRN